jgi:hypothetical protein
LNLQEYRDEDRTEGLGLGDYGSFRIKGRRIIIKLQGWEREGDHTKISRIRLYRIIVKAAE